LEPEFKLESAGIDTDALERELARRVAERRASGVYTDEVEAQLAERLPDEEGAGDLPCAAALDYAATRARASWDVTTAYPVETEKPFPRPLILFAKRLARLWARVAVGPIQREQTAFNRHVAAALEALRLQSISERAEALAAEEDLAALAGSMIGGDEAAAMAASIADALGLPGSLTVLQPSPPGLVAALAERGFLPHAVSAGTAWDEAPGARVVTHTGPLTFLSQVGEESTAAMLVSELSFWLKPEALIALARRSYLALERDGRIAIAVHAFAAGSPAPAWCAAPVVARALELAGFSDITITDARSPRAGQALPSGYVAVARKT
jgi:hypothetical protein